MKKIFNNLFNIFWIIFVGLGGAFTSILLGCIYCVTIIGIPFGTRYFKFTKLIFAPAGKTVNTDYGKHPVLNTLWLIFGGGLASWFSYSLMIIFFYITIIGIPIAKQLKKVRKYYLAPFGAEIVKDDEETALNENSEEKVVKPKPVKKVVKPKPVKYDFKSFYKEEKYSPLIYQTDLPDKERFTSFYDFKLLFRRICADPNKKIKSQNGENTQTVAEYLKSLESEIKKSKKKHDNLTGILILSIVGIFFLIASIFLKHTKFDGSIILLIAIPLFIVTFILLPVKNPTFMKPYCCNLFDTYPDGCAMVEEKQGTLDDVFVAVGFKEEKYPSLLNK